MSIQLHLFLEIQLNGDHSFLTFKRVALPDYLFAISPPTAAEGPLFLWVGLGKKTNWLGLGQGHRLLGLY